METETSTLSCASAESLLYQEFCIAVGAFFAVESRSRTTQGRVCRRCQLTKRSTCPHPAMRHSRTKEPWRVPLPNLRVNTALLDVYVLNNRSNTERRGSPLARPSAKKASLAPNGALVPNLRFSTETTLVHWPVPLPKLPTIETLLTQRTLDSATA